MRSKEVYQNEIKSDIIRAVMTMSEAVKILAGVLGHDIAWQKRREVR